MKKYSPFDVRGLCALVVRTMLTGREDYIRTSKGLYSFSSPPGIDQTNRTFAVVETALRGRRNGTSRASKHTLAGNEKKQMRKQIFHFSLFTFHLFVVPLHCKRRNDENE